MCDTWCINGCEVGFPLNTSVFTRLYPSTSAHCSFQILPTIHCTWTSSILTLGSSFLQPQLNLDTYHLTLHNSLLSSRFMLYFCSFCCCNLTGYFHISPHLQIKNKCVMYWNKTKFSKFTFSPRQILWRRENSCPSACHEGIWYSGGCEFHLILILALYGGEWTVSSPSCYTPEESLWLPINRRLGYWSGQ